MTSNPVESPSAQEVPLESPRRLIIRWTIALCIFTAGGFAFSELVTNLFSSYTVLIAGSGLVGWGFISGIGAIVGAVMYLVWSTISDNLRTRWGRRIPLMLIGGVSTAGLAILFAMSRDYLWLLLDGGILLAITRSMFGPSRSLRADLIPQERRGRTNTILTLMTNLGSVIFWIPALLLVFSGNEKNIEMNFLFIIVFSLVLVISTIITAILIREPPVSEPPRNWLRDFASIVDWQEMKKQKNFLKIFVANLFLQAADSAIFTYFFIFIENVFNRVSIDLVTIIIAAPIVGAALGIGLYLLAKMTDNVGRKLPSILGLLFAPVGALIIAASNDNLLILLIGFGIFFPFYLGGTSSVESWFQDILPKEARGRFFGLINITSALGIFLGAVMSGYIGDANIFWIFVASAILLWTSVPFFLRVPETLKRKLKEITPTGMPTPE
jgi:MFS family permease